MENDGKFMEAEVVEKVLARRAYDDFLHRRQDPALLEKAAGNQFTAKVFPIPAKADKPSVISYSQELPGARYLLPLRGPPKIDSIHVSLAVTGADGKRDRTGQSDPCGRNMGRSTGRCLPARAPSRSRLSRARTRYRWFPSTTRCRPDRRRTCTARRPT